MGTSLTVHPFAALVNKVNEDCVRFLINREEVGVDDARSSIMAILMGTRNSGL